MEQTALANARTPGSSSSGLDYSAYLSILDKNLKLIAFTPNRAQVHYRQHRTSRNLILKARQLGMSTAIQADNFTAAISQTTLSATMAHDDQTTQKLRRMADRFYDNLPPSIRPPRGLDNATTTTYPLTNSEVTIVTAGSGNAGRGGTYNRLHGSEVAFWKDAASVMAGIMQGVPLDGVIELESTPNGAQGWFYERCMEALDGNSDWSLHFYPWWWEDGYQIALARGETLAPYTNDELALIGLHHLTPPQMKWRRAKQRELGRLFLQEYPEDPRACFLTSGQGYFGDIVDLDTRFSAPVDAVYDPSHRYIGALDFGQKQDYSSLSVIDATTLEEVELWRLNRVPWSDIRAKALKSAKQWRLESLHPEENSMGGTNIEELRKEFAAADCKTSIVPFTTTPQSKPMMVTAFHWALDEGGLKLLPDPVGRQELYGYIASQTPSGAWKYEGLPHDDTVIARIGAWHGLAAGHSTIGFVTQNWA